MTSAVEILGNKYTIRDRNKQFDLLSSEGKRVAIAQDVIAQVLKGFITPEAGLYVNAWSFKNESCRVCAIGAVAVSCFNSKAHDVTRNLTEFSELATYFDMDNLREMEAAFECCGDFRVDDLPSARNYYDFWGDDSDNWHSEHNRLLLIFSNVINNGGTFHPDYLENEIEAFKRDGDRYFSKITGVSGDLS